MAFSKPMAFSSVGGRGAKRSGVCNGHEKKSLAASERNEEHRENWGKQMRQQEAQRLVCLDEGGSNIALTSVSARAQKGERARWSVPRNQGKNMTLIASLSLEGLGASLLLEGGVDALAFETYVEQVLAPTLPPGQIVVRENVSVHNVARVQQLIEDQGSHLLFLPASSPDFSPIEETFSTIKAFLRRTGARTREALQEAIAQALLTLTTQDPHGWFHHCGSPVPQERQRYMPQYLYSPL